MKKIFLTIAFAMLLGFGVSAQGDGFFNNWNDGTRDEWNALPDLPGSFGFGGNSSAWLGSDVIGASWMAFEEGYTTPLGGGLLILTVLGAGYAVAKRKER